HDEPERPLVAVRREEDDRLVEVRITEGRRRDEEPRSKERGHLKDLPRFGGVGERDMSEHVLALDPPRQDAPAKDVLALGPAGRDASSLYVLALGPAGRDASSLYVLALGPAGRDAPVKAFPQYAEFSASREREPLAGRPRDLYAP